MAPLLKFLTVQGCGVFSTELIHRVNFGEKKKKKKKLLVFQSTYLVIVFGHILKGKADQIHSKHFILQKTF